MDNASNWEFAASIAAVCIGLGGLLLFTLVGTVGSWLVLSRASRAANEAAKATIVVQDLARQLAFREASQPVVDVSQAASQLAGLRVQADALLQQQKRLQDAVRNLVEAGVLQSQGGHGDLSDLQGAVKRLEENLGRISASVANLGQKQS
jgi:hypothetical protein